MLEFQSKSSSIWVCFPMHICLRSRPVSPNVVCSFVSQSVSMLKIVIIWLCDRVTKWPSDQVTKWPSDQVTKWPSHQVTEWPSDRVTGWQEASQMIDRMVYLFSQFCTKDTNQNVSLGLWFSKCKSAWHHITIFTADFRAHTEWVDSMSPSSRNCGL